MVGNIANDGPDEETPLLGHLTSTPGPTPLPRLQLSVILLGLLSEPITSQCIYPFINQLISELDITGGDERKVGYYAGLIEALFFATEAITVLHWSRLSDYVGRKPVILVGLSGIFVSMMCFGLSRSFWGLVASRCLCGMLNGNVGVMKAFMAEIADESNMAQAFAMMPITWCVGATIGPFLGGTLGRPHERFPHYFRGQFWKTYPYFLPCAVSGSVSIVAFFVTLLFLKETVQRRKVSKEQASFESLDDLTLRNISCGTVPDQGELVLVPHSISKEEPVPLRALLVFPVLISITNYVLLALLEISKAALQPLFLSTPIEYGGLGLSPPTIGLILGLYGFVDGFFQALFFSKIVGRWGPKRVFFCGVAVFIPIYSLFPIMSILAQHGGLSSLVWITLGIEIFLGVIADLAFACIFMFVTSSAPNKHSLGATNGLSQTSVSIARALGPAMSTSLFAFSAEHGLLGGYAVYVVFILLTCFSLLSAAQLPDKMWTKEVAAK